MPLHRFALVFCLFIAGATCAPAAGDEPTGEPTPPAVPQPVTVGPSQSGQGGTEPATQPTTAPATQPEAEPLPPADEILKKAIAAMGKQEEIDAIESVRINLTQSGPNQPKQSLDISSNLKDQLVCRVERDGEWEITYFQNGRLAWMEFPSSNPADTPATRIQLIDPSNIWRVGELAETTLVLPRLQRKYSKIETVSKAERAGEMCYGLRFADPVKLEPFEYSGDHLIYISVESGRLISADQPSGRRATDRVTSYFSKWNTFGNFTTFTRLESYWESDQLTILIRDLAFNTVDESIFEIPESLRPAAAPAEPAPIDAEPKT